MKIKRSSKNGGVLVELGPTESQFPASAADKAALPEFRIKNILVPVDFSDCSKKALEYAIPFARRFGAELKLLHVVELYSTVPELGAVDVETITNSNARLAALRGELDESVAATTISRSGASAHAEITRTARELDIDLIILATHGHTGFSRMLLGSTAEKVVRHAPCPVLIVRETEREFVASNACETV